MPSCVFKHCKNSSQKPKNEEGISFHRFPADPVLQHKWVCIVRENRQYNNWLPSKFCVVCSSHFKTEDFYFTEKGRRLIKKKSKPTQNLNESSQKISGVATEGLRCSVEKDATKDTATSSNLFIVNQLPGPSNKDNPIDSEISDSDLDSIFDTPRESYLRKQLRKHQLLRAVTKRKIKTLQEKVRRLKKRNASLINILKKIKSENFKKLGQNNSC